MSKQKNNSKKDYKSPSYDDFQSQRKKQRRPKRNRDYGELKFNKFQ